MVDMQVTAELAALLAVVVHVTELMAVASVFPLFSIVIVNEISPHTGVVEHVYVTFSLASAVVFSTVQLGVVATEIQAVLQRNSTIITCPVHSILYKPCTKWLRQILYNI